MKRASNSGLYHFGKKTGNPVRLWERVTTGVRRRQAFQQLKARADQGRDLEARFWLARLKLNHGQFQRGWRILNELWFQDYRDETFVNFLWKKAVVVSDTPTSGGLNLLDHRVRWNLALYFWKQEKSEQVPESIVNWLEQGWLGSIEFRSFCEQVEDTGLLVKLVGVLTDHAAHSALLHILYRRLWALIQGASSRIDMGEIRVLLAGLDYLPNVVWQFCFDCWQERRQNPVPENNQYLEEIDELENWLIDYFFIRRERGFFPFQTIRELGKAKQQKREKSLRATQLFNYLRFREARAEEWNLALTRCILPGKIPPDHGWFKQAQEWTEMPVVELLALLERVFRSGCREQELVVSLGMYLLNAPEDGQVENISGLAPELWNCRDYIPAPERVRLGIVLAREKTGLELYEQALEIVEECFAIDFRCLELYLIGLKAANILGKVQDIVTLLEKAESCLNREELEKVRSEAASNVLSRRLVHPAIVRAQLKELTKEPEPLSSAVPARYLLSDWGFSGEELYCLRNIALKRSRNWEAGKGPAVKDPLQMVLVRQEGLNGLDTPGRFRNWVELVEDPVYGLHFLLNKLQSGDWKVISRNRDAVNLACQLWRSGIARREEMVLDFLVTAFGQLGEGEDIKQDDTEQEDIEQEELLAALGEYCLGQGRVDQDACGVYHRVYRLRPDNLANLYYLCKSLLTEEIPISPGPGYGANVQVWSSVFSGDSRLPVIERPGIGPVVRVKRVFSERLVYQVKYFGGGETVGEFSPAELSLLKERMDQVEPAQVEAGQVEPILVETNVLLAEVEIFLQAYRHFPNYQDNLVNVALLSAFIDLEEGFKLQVLERCLNLGELREEALGVFKRELAKLMLKQGNYARVKDLLLPDEISELTPEALAVYWAAGCQVALGLLDGEEALKALTGSEAVCRSLTEKIRGTGDGLV